MTNSQREKIINRILSGRIIFKLPNNKQLVYKGPTVRQKYLAEEYYENYLEEYELNGLYTETEYLNFLLEKNLWSYEEENELVGLKEKIEDKKIEFFEKYISSVSRNAVKKQLESLKSRYEFLYSKKNIEIHKTATGLAGIAKLRFLIGVSLYDINGNPLFNEDLFWDNHDCDLLDRVVNLYNQSQLQDYEYRELCRNEPWRSYWMCRKACGGKVLDKSSSKLTEEQRSLIYWTLLYDNIYENPDCPSDDVINDDDAIDGFLLKQNRERRTKTNKNELEDKLSDKIKNNDEIFIPLTIADRDKIEALNSNMGQAIKSVRNKVIHERKNVTEIDLPDVKRDLSMQSVKEFGEKMKGQK